MVKKELPEKIITEVNAYKKLLEADNLPIVGVYIFGSHAKGNARIDSDIDVAVISPNFESPWSALDYLYDKLPYGKGWTIEPIGFSPNDFSNKYSSLIHEIKTYGVEV
ncbi:MAG: nucleotidyltransferase domain-containing protein [Patescibacteria group bacterium]